VGLLERAGLPTALPDTDAQRGAYLRGIAVDKKLIGERVGFVVLREIGRAERVQLTPEEILPEAE
jgi:3-dehydroquinate synthetase